MLGLPRFAPVNEDAYIDVSALRDLVHLGTLEILGVKVTVQVTIWNKQHRFV